jgi:DNA invertase Pin-like site-specific DNA recombinase
MISTDSIPIAIRYTRVSSDDQRDNGVSLDAQAARTTDYVANQGGWQLEPRIYTDVLSGLRDERVGYQALLAQLRTLRSEGQNVVVVVMKFDRFGRDIAERVRAWRELRDLGVQIHSVTEGGVVTEFVWNIHASVAQEEVRLISERTSIAWEHIMGQGWHMVGKRPYGYRWRDRTGEERAQGAPALVLEPDETEAAHVREAFRRVAAGQSARGVGRWLASLPESERGGRLMRWRTVQHLLRSPAYVGRMEADGAPGRWPAIVDETTWNAVQDRLDGHARQPKQASQRYLLTGLIFCPKCDSRMQGAHMTVGGTAVLRYRCGSSVRESEGPRCNWTAAAPKVDALVLEHVGTLIAGVIANNGAVRHRMERKWNELRQPAAQQRDVERKRTHLTRQVEDAKQRIGQATELLIGKQIEQDAYQLVCAKARLDIEAANAELQTMGSTAALAPTLPPLAEVIARAQDWQAVLENGAAAQVRDVLIELVERVTPLRPRHATYEPAIVWTELATALATIAADMTKIAA